MVFIKLRIGLRRSKLTDIKQQNSYIIYGSESCTNCKQAIQLLNQKEQHFVYKSFPEDYSLEELAELVGKPTRSVPQIFEVGEGNKLQYVGGLMDLVKYLKQ